MLKPLYLNAAEQKLFTTQQNLDLLFDRTQAGIKALVDTYAYDGDAKGFGDSLAALLLSHHTRAAVVGRQRAGDLFPEEDDDRTFAALIMQGEQPFLDRFVADLSGGHYEDEDGTLDTAAILRRADLYPRRGVGLANENFVLASGEDFTFEWILGDPITAHCEDCPDLAAGSPYAWDALPTTPGSNQTECIFNCLCELVRSDGRKGFTQPEHG